MQRTKQHYFDNSNGGLDYLLKQYPAAASVIDKNRNFCVDNNDSTASGRIKNKNGIYYFYDYRIDKTGRNAIDLVMQQQGCEFYDALEFLYKEGNIPTLEGKNSLRAEWRTEETYLEKDHWHVEYKDSPRNLTVFAPFLTADHCEPFNFKSVAYYEFVSYVKDDKGNNTEKKQLNKVIASDEYPIFAFAEKDFVKIYEPFAKKAYRFRFFGKKPHNFIYGWDYLLSLVDIDKIDYLRAKIKEADSVRDKKALQEELNELLLDEVLIASGGSDGLNLASLGFLVIWFNSETEQISFKDYQLLKKICKGVYNVPDLDPTGERMAVKLGLDYLDLKTIWLPLEYNPTDKSPKKDVRDWIGKYKTFGRDWLANQLTKLIENALCFKWWEWNKTGSNYRYNYVNLIYFLEHQGFYVHKIEHRNAQKGKIENIFIKIDGHIACEVHPSEIKVFLQDWLKDRQIKLQVRNMVIGSRGINSEQLLSLPRRSLNYRLALHYRQYFFFNNKAIQVMPNEIKEVKPEELGVIIWDNKIVKHDFTLGTNQFRIFKDEAGYWDIEIFEKNNPYLNYLINASRVHWRKELEEFFGTDTAAKEAYHAAHRYDIAGPNLSIEEIREQKHHLVNKIFGLGYLLHGFKDDSKAWALTAIDNRLPDLATDSNGRSGKSIYIGKPLEYLKNRVVLKGRDPRLTDNQFIYDEVSEETEVIFIDDAHYNLDYGFLFSEITGSTKVNKKHGLQFEIPFNRSPKFAVSTNFLPKDLNSSLRGRLLLTVFSDYYHIRNGNDYLEDRSPASEMGIIMLTENSPPAEFNLFYNFCLQALQFYMNTPEKLEAPEGNVEKRNFMQVMGDSFHEWASEYFVQDDDGFSPRLNVMVERRLAMDDYNRFTKNKGLSAQKWKRALEAFCKLQGWELNPKHLVGKDGRIKQKVNTSEGTVALKEMIYINATGNIITREGNTIVSRSPNGDQVTVQQPQLPLNHEPPNMYDEIFRPEEGTGIDSINENEF